MFLKRLERRKSGKKHTDWALVESVRTERGSRHRVVAYLGELNKRERTGWAQLGRRLNGQGRPQPSLFDPPHYDDPTDEEPVLVKLNDIRLQRLRDFGEVWLALGLWRMLGLDTLLSELMPAGREEVAWPVVAAILMIALSIDVERYAPIIRFLAWLTIAFGVLILGIDLAADLPTYWTLFEAPTTVLLGLAMLLLAPRAGRAAEGVPD